jgi:hypothetical protein
MPKPLPGQLYHYTGIQGLKGIIESQTLWATHYKYLNDAEEVVHFRERLPSILSPVFTNLLQDFGAAGKQALIDTYGTIENALVEEPRRLAQVMYDVTFANADSDGIFAEPFIVAFCTVDKENERVATPVPYINLFNEITSKSGKQLPIQHVIVGPHPDRERRKMAVEELLRQNGTQADVLLSAIPYVG